MKKALIALLLALVLSGCKSGGSGTPTAPPAQGGRILGLHVRQVPGIPFATAYQQAMALGVRESSVSLDWQSLEPTVGHYDDTLPATIDSFYPYYAGDLTLVLRPLDTAGPRLPTDLAGKAFDDPAVITAFEDFLVHLHGQLATLNASGRLKWIQVGNEVDATLGSDATRWSQWQTFFVAAKAKIRSLWGADVKVSSIVQFKALTGPAVRPLYLQLLPDLDEAALTYYPLNADFTVRAPSSVAADFDRMTSVIANKPIVLQECGYPASAVNDSSPARQADFVSAVFDAWDTWRERIAVIDFAWQYDVDESTADQWVIDYGMSASPYATEFKYYLWTLGLNHHDGTQKPAWQRLNDELQARNWVR